MSNHTPSSPHFDAEQWARDFLNKVALYPSMLTVGIVAAWFRSAVQAHDLDERARKKERRKK
jgi:hypothetical protein